MVNHIHQLFMVNTDTLVLGDENAHLSLLVVVTSSDFWAISVDRSRYKESLLPGSTTLSLTNGANDIVLTDNSQCCYFCSHFNDAGRVFQLVSGSAGTVFTGKK
jgi:hypothetical protein